MLDFEWADLRRVMVVGNVVANFPTVLMVGNGIVGRRDTSCGVPMEIPSIVNDTLFKS